MRELIARGRVLPLLTLLTGLFIVGSVTTKNIAIEAVEAQSPVTADANPLLANWVGPYGGVPPFNRVQISYFKPALEAAMQESLSQVDQIANSSAAPTFENTIAALERSGRTLNRVTTVYGVWAGTMASPEFQIVQREMAPKLAAFNDQITQNEALFKRIDTIYNSPEKKKLTPEQQRLAWLYYVNFIRSGAKLGTEAKARLSQINQELAGRSTRAYTPSFFLYFTGPKTTPRETNGGPSIEEET